MTARRYDQNKIRHSLIPVNAIEEIARVYTIGAEKYHVKDENGNIIDRGDNNWKKGLPFNKVLDAVQRHISKWRKGESFDTEYPVELLERFGPTHHLANAVWGLITLMELERIKPGFDDRQTVQVKRIGLDIDSVVADFNGHCAEIGGFNRLDINCHNYGPLIEVYDECKSDPEFWGGMKPLFHPLDIKTEICCYITARPEEYREETMEWLKRNGMPEVELIMDGNKAKHVIEKNLDIFVDDNIYNFTDINNNTNCLCLLMDSEHNKMYNVGNKRIANLEEVNCFLKS